MFGICRAFDFDNLEAQLKAEKDIEALLSKSLERTGPITHAEFSLDHLRDPIMRARFEALTSGELAWVGLFF